jgi:DNA-cytosine methyltransferase
LRYAIGGDAVKAISLFSGVGGFELGFEKAGIETVLQAEQDPWAAGVLAHHWPETRRVTDVRDVSLRTVREGMGTTGRLADMPGVRGGGLRGDDSDGVDLIYGGFPCQDVSVAGARAGLAGERSGLWHEFHRVLRELRPAWAVIENVAGLLSSNSGRDFAVILDGLVELGYGVAYRVLDAQHFGVAQRRRRVFLVGSLGGATRAAAVLAVCEGCGGDTPKGGEAGERPTETAVGSIAVAGWDPVNVTSRTNRSRVEYGKPSPTLHEGGMSIAIRTANTGANGHGVAEDVTHTLDGAQGQAVLASAVSASAGHHGHSSPRGDGSDNLVVAKPLLVPSHGAAWKGDGTDNLVVANPLPAHHSRHDLAMDTYVPDVAYAIAAREAKGVSLLESQTNYIAKTAGVRRLTPLECERLMGWPDGHTRWACMDGVTREVPDSHRYRMCGNGVVSHVAEWIGRRLVAVDGGMK